MEGGNDTYSKLDLKTRKGNHLHGLVTDFVIRNSLSDPKGREAGDISGHAHFKRGHDIVRGGGGNWTSGGALGGLRGSQKGKGRAT